VASLRVAPANQAAFDDVQLCSAIGPAARCQCQRYRFSRESFGRQTGSSASTAA
jgi:hypothetical protein